MKCLFCLFANTLRVDDGASFVVVDRELLRDYRCNLSIDVYILFSLKIRTNICIFSSNSRKSRVNIKTYYTNTLRCLLAEK